ncbi:hypothetical protein ASPVEDRAFT_38329 [Aspergillus versicolor CBS 583.65]|uniref:Yeast cell wall synthesis Kre9/Knh1-like N-terminal domain-containing protein n=1 Tax=Aspergillus versicolor CBS 583.65 TaxID=1036611 RepID=A0A1L9PBJ9_ASPVE|nr:uncharacterized protein ASPVEDRAFT_38329 [Aspergillus versicolor CBS 583.65]OJI98834.1 hypothetical protein ASPVEDRAFT_38329 [Aspergillus versicolor CBS 583.65]
MHLTLVTSLLPLAVSVGALSVTEPKKGAEVDPSDSFTVKWDSVSTDPSSFDIYLVNNAVYPSVDKKIASDVDASDGSYTVDGLSGLTDGHGFQINLFSNEDKNTGILAQSEQFNMTGDASSTSSTSSTSSSSTSTSASSSSSIPSSSASSTKTESTSASSTSDSDSSSTSGAGSSSASSSGAAPSSTGVPSVDDNAGAALGAPLTVIAGLVGAACAFSL